MKKYDLKIRGKEFKVEVADFKVKSAKVLVNGKEYEVAISYPESEDAPVFIPKVAKAAAVNVQAAPAAAKAAASKTVNAPMPGLILKVLVKVGDTVKTGQKVMSMEAMKMENDINSTVAGIVKEIRIKETENVKEGDILLVLE